ncbi:CHAP domain-containing protein [Dactylosporangium sp. NPDC048998]|uniref:CHAP domain-containing protein n=1 Tax=Dactylosporangium sp. NPDC048998 TaxID=3363976 RepID=UPI0037108112
MATKRSRLALALAAMSCLAGFLAVTASPAQAVNNPVRFGPYTAKADIDGRGSMNVDDRIKTNAYLLGATMYLICQDTGPSYGGSTIWDYTTDGYWEPDAYVKTGIDGFVSGMPRCLSLGIDGRSKVGTVKGEYVAKVDVDGRGSMNPDDRIKYNAYLAGQQVFIKCQDYGPAVAGDTVWDYTANGYWVPDTYIKTGTDGVVPGMPICSSIGIDGKAPTNLNGGQRFSAATDLNGWSAKSLSSSSVNNAYRAGEYITIMCQAYGEYNYGGDAIWDRTAEGYWVADYYVHTGSMGFVMKRCDNDNPSGSSSGGGKYLAKTTLNGYRAKSLTASYVNDKYPAGSYITITCQAYGEFNYGGSAVWDKTSDGLWVADYYVKTGYVDIFMPKCDSDPKPTNGPGNPSVPPTPATGSIASSEMRQKIVNAVAGQLGTHEWGDNCNPYGLNGVICGSAWCSIFASWAWRQAGINIYLPYSGDFYHWGSSHGTLRSTSNIRPGDVVLFGTSAGASNHIGVVVDVDSSGAITTIEGNFSDQVMKVGPYQPSSAASYHPGDGGIFAVVAPVNDSGDTKWLSDYNSGNADPVCALDLSGSTPQYVLCLQFNGGGVRGIVLAAPNGPKSYGATVSVTMGSGTAQTTRCLTIYASGFRTCATPWISVTAQSFHADADITVNDKDQKHQRAFSMKLAGNQQTKWNYCGPASTQAALGTMGLAMPSQDVLATEERTNDLDFTMPTSIPPSLNSRVSGGGYGAYFYPNEGLPELVGLESLRQSLERGRPVILLVNPNKLPASWNISKGTILRHYIMIYGYGGQKDAIATGVPYDIQTFNVWDPANNVTHIMNLIDLYNYTYNAELVGTGSFIAIST